MASFFSASALYLFGHNLLVTPIEANRTGTPLSAAPLPPFPKHPGELPVFGDGVLQEIVAIRHVAGNTVAVNAVGPSAGQIVHYLTPAEVKTVGNATFAVERYGAIPRGEIALSFDDGPSIWTPKILDLLSKYHIQATFFVIGQNVAKYPQYVQREVREGHVIGNHTFTHPDLPALSAFWIRTQIFLDDHLIRAVTHRATLFFRNPYDGNDPASINRDINSIYEAQKAGYIIVGQNTDTNDWQFETEHVPPVPLGTILKAPYPETTQGFLLLLHDGGGDRAQTLAYLEKAIPWALAHGYEFTTLRWSVPASANAYSVVTPSLTDRITLWASQGIFDWVTYLLLFLFVFGIGTVVLLNMIFIILACAQDWLQRRRVRSVPKVACPVTVIIAAYNEAPVIAKTVESILGSTHERLDIIVVNDGSTDGTLEILQQLAASHPQIRVIDQENAGKAAALNRAFAEASSDFIVTGDADTIFAPEAISFLVDHLVRNEKVGAVAGLVRVGNIRGLLTAWQALEYIKSIAVTRTAEHVMRTITVVPGACSVWRREAVLQAGGFDSRTLAEDCELTIRLQRAGWKIEQDNRAVSYTEVPEGVRRLYKQRIRWTFGNIQVFWMHKNMMFHSRYGLLGMFTIPYAMLSVAMPVLFLPLLYAVMTSKVAGGAGATLLPYLIGFTIADMIVSAVGVLITRSSPLYLLIAPFYRVINEPLRMTLLYHTVYRAAMGKVHGWNKLLRTGNVSLEPHARAGSTAHGDVPVLAGRTAQRPRALSDGGSPTAPEGGEHRRGSAGGYSGDATNIVLSGSPGPLQDDQQKARLVRSAPGTEQGDRTPRETAPRSPAGSTADPCVPGGVRLGALDRRPARVEEGSGGPTAGQSNVCAGKPRGELRV